MNETMDNQQETLLRLAWLAGIFDGEGTFCIVKLERKHRVNYVAKASLSNTSEPMINGILDVLRAHNIGVHVWNETSPRKSNHKKAYHLTINKKEDVKRLATLLTPYLVNKKQVAQNIINFIISREDYKPKVGRDSLGRITGVEKQGYSEYEESLYLLTRELNKTGAIVDPQRLNDKHLQYSEVMI